MLCIPVLHPCHRPLTGDGGAPVREKSVLPGCIVCLFVRDLKENNVSLDFGPAVVEAPEKVI
ncbi:MAG: hypothetical protein DRP22_02585 [Verrucomicrobia bacterium]|nr:MAG: hypothetical protein DRP22_02585 [Verrucomicrobiota bacterium]